MNKTYKNFNLLKGIFDKRRLALKNTVRLLISIVITVLVFGFSGCGEKIDIVEEVNNIYNSDQSIEEMLTNLKSLEDIDSDDMQYYTVVNSYLNELKGLKDSIDINSVNNNVKNAMTDEVDSQDSFINGTESYYNIILDVISMQDSLKQINDKTEYGSIAVKKDFEFIGEALSKEAVLFYDTVIVMNDICNTSNEIETKCFGNLPYPSKMAAKDEGILESINQNYSETALEENTSILSKLEAIQSNIPQAMFAITSDYIGGLEVRGEYLEFQKQYMDLEKEKNGYILAVDELEAEYEKAREVRKEYKRNHGRDDEYDRLDEAEDALKNELHEMEDIVWKKAKEIKDKQKPIRYDANVKRELYIELLGLEEQLLSDESQTQLLNKPADILGNWILPKFEVKFQFREDGTCTYKNSGPNEITTYTFDKNAGTGEYIYVFDGKPKTLTYNEDDDTFLIELAAGVYAFERVEK